MALATSAGIRMIFDQQADGDPKKAANLYAAMLESYANQKKMYTMILIYMGVPCILLFGIGFGMIAAGIWMRRDVDKQQKTTEQVYQLWLAENKK
ncbi:MAG: hypothetical protein Q8O24_00160 [Gallionellaceae bacterium]|nr:hypothetical protein [Gallionellaceae bacterium]